MVLSTYQKTRRHVPEDRTRSIRRRETQKFNWTLILVFPLFQRFELNGGVDMYAAHVAIYVVMTSQVFLIIFFSVFYLCNFHLL
jgi:hypothetical protein